MTDQSKNDLNKYWPLYMPNLVLLNFFFSIDFQVDLCRSEIAHLAELLQSRAAEVSPGDASQINVVPAVDSGRQNQFESRVSEGNRNDGNKSSPVMFTPIQSSHVR